MIKPNKLPSQKFLWECFRYERSTGKLFWRNRPLSHFVSVRGWKIWNKRWPGTEAFTQVIEGGYRRGAINKVTYLAHRVVWKMMTGKEPPDLIDHKDRKGGNNRWRNLRETTPAKNCTNKGCKGVSFSTESGKWRARATDPAGKRIHIGWFDEEQQALAARAIVMQDMHGEFAP